MDPNNIWQTPPFPDEGDADATTLYAAVGEALSYWEVFEGNLSLLFVQFVTPGRELDALRAAYGEVAAFGGRRDMLKAAGKRYFMDHPATGMSVQFQQLIKAAEKGGAVRNLIAHGVVQPHMNPRTKTRSGFALVPGYYATRKRDNDFKPSYALTTPQVHRLGLQFRELAVPVFELTAAILTKHARSPP